ncbi:RICIN domain-containing protein [Streptomyces sp. NPDC051976]|uniref:RICIN domain-containing protein n=1 Tax=Streptomyces sp. NPDC051976 TaxID=3154947 RepID=UPI0034197018
MRTRKGSALLAVTLTVGMATLGLVQTASAATPKAPTKAATSEAMTIVHVTSLSQIPTAYNTRAGQATPNVAYSVTLRNAHSGQCLDGDLNTIGHNGAKVQLWACNGRDNQSWIFVPNPTYGPYFYTIRNAHSGQCLDADTNTIGYNGTKVQLWACTGSSGGSNQSFSRPPGNTLQNYTDGQCLDGDLNTIGYNGTKVQLWDCNGWDNQSWLE